MPVPAEITETLREVYSQDKIDTWLTTRVRDLGFRTPLDAIAEGPFGTWRVACLAEKAAGR